MRRLTFPLIAVLCVLTPSSVLVAQSPPLTPFRGLIDHVSADQWGGTNSSGETWHHAISGDGRYVVFNSYSDLVANDNDYNGMDDIFVRDRSTGTTTRVSMASDGGPGDGISQYGTISTNGRYAAFASGSSNLVSGDTNNHWDVFVRDLDQQTTVRISVATDGTQGDRDSYYPSLSADGRFVAFLSWATTFAPNVGSSAPRQAYLHDRDADADGIFDEPGEVTTELISAGLSGEIADGSVDTPRVSTDGRVLFESDATNLSDVGNNGQNHLYLRNRSTSQTELIDRAVTGGPSAWGVYYGTSDMSDDGRFITFSSISPDIVWFDMNWQSQAFLYDTVAGPAATQIVSKLPDGTLADASSYATSVSGDGRYVVFTTDSSNLASPPPGASGPAMLAVRDMLDGSFARVDVLDNGDAFDESDYYMTPAISADGTAIVLQSRSQYALNGGYGWGVSHAFVLTALAASPMSASFPMSGGAGTIDVDTSAVTGWDASTADSWIVIEGYAAPYPVHFAGPGTVHYEVGDNPSGIARDGWIRIGLKMIAIHQEGDGDPTPPVITPIITGTQVNGWYTSDITLTFEVSDPDSEIVDLSYNCTHTLTFTSDFLYAAPQCEATSHGGRASVTVPLRRDTTPPSVFFAQPRPTIYPYGEIVNVSYACYESLSPVTSCVGPTMWSPIDTWTRGPHSVTVTATDEAGNTATRTIDYLVPTDQCISSPAAPANLKRWFMFDGNLSESISGLTASGSISNGTFETGMVRQGWSNNLQYNYLSGLDAASAVAGPSGLTVAMWVKPLGVFYPFTLPDYQTLVFNPKQYHVVAWNDGTLRWAFNTTTGFNWVNTGVRLEWTSWYHVALTYEDGIVRTFVNGNLVHTQALSGSLMTGPSTADLQIGGESGGVQNHAFRGVIDDLMIFDTVLPASDLENLALSGSGSFCIPFESHLTVTAPQTITFGNAFGVWATLTDAMGLPIAHQRLRLTADVAPPEYVFEVETDSQGSVVVDFPISSAASMGAHPNGVTVEFAGDTLFAPEQANADLYLVPGTPLVFWEPEPLTYGTPLGAAQQNAVSMPGTYVYQPAAGTLLGAGPRTLSVTITPDDPHYAQHIVWRTIVVNKATPTIEISSAHPVYNGQPQAASATVRGVGGVTLTPATVLYNGSTTPPVNAGTYPIEVQFAGDSNYAATSVTVSFTIDKATPTVTATGGTFTYDNQPHAGSGSAVGVLGETLTPVTLIYDGSSSAAPTDAGDHTVRASFAGSSNYLPAQSADVALTINRATPTVDISTAPVFYNGQERRATISIRGIAGELLNPRQERYDGSPTPPTNAGTYALEVQYAGSTNYLPVTVNGSFVIRKAFPLFPTLNNLTFTYDGQPHPGYNLPVRGVFLESLTPLTTTYNGSTTPPVTVGVYTSVLRYDGSANYEADSRTYTLTINVGTPSVTWEPDSLTYGQGLGAAQLDATANVPGTFVYYPPAGTILNAGLQFLVVTFTPDDSVNYRTTSVGRDITVFRAHPQLTWAPPASIVFGTPLSATQLNATANTTGTFVYNYQAGAVLSAGQWTLSVTFTPEFWANYYTETRTVPLTVVKATPVVSWTPPSDIVYGTALGAAQLNATANVPGTFAYSPAAGMVLNAGARTLSVTFTPTNGANYNSASASVPLTVAKATPAITWPNPANIIFGTPLSGSQLNATANVPGTLSYSPAAGAVLNAGTQTLSVTFTPTFPANYNVASASVSLTVDKAASSISWSNPANIVYGTALSGAQLNATANVPGTFNYSPATGTQLNAGSHTLSVNFTPDDAANYNASSANVSLTVTKAASTINWPNPANIVYGTALGGSQLNATASVPGTFNYSPATGTQLNAGSHTLSVTFTPDDAANYNGASANVSLTVTRAASTISWSNPANIVYGTALGGSQLNATANVPGTFNYSPATGTQLNAGSHTLSVTFTPDDAANYNGASANVSLTVTKAESTISWSNPAGIVYGTAVSGTQLNATASVPGSFVYSPVAGTVLNAGTQQLSVTFTPTDAANYSSAAASVSIVVAQATPVVSWSNPAGITYGTPLSGTQLNASANVAGSFAYSLAAGTVLSAGNPQLSVTFTPADAANYTSATASVTVAIAAKALTVQANDATKVYGAALPSFTASGTGFVNGDSMASLGGTLAFATSATATSAPGAYSVTPSGVSSPNYSITFAAGTLTVAKADTSLTLTTTPNPSQNNQAVQIRAVVAAVAPGAGTPTGTVSFYENGTLLGTATLTNGVATMNKNFKHGTHPLTATYAASTNFNGSTGAVTHSTQ